MYKSRIQIFENILSPMISCIDDKDYKVTFWRKLQGYGLKASDFEKFDGCSRRVFSHWKNFMLERKLIRIPRVKRKQNKNPNERSFRNLPYIITPLGICYFISLLGEINLSHTRKIIKILSYYSSYNLHMDWEKICEIISAKEAHQILKKVCDSLDVIDVNNEIHVVLSYSSKGKVTYEFFRYVLNGGQIRLQLLEDVHTNESVKNQTPTSTPIIDEETFHRDIAEFIVEAFCYSIIETCHWKILNRSHTLGWVDLSIKEKLDFKNTMTKYEAILKNIPFEVHLSSFNFIGQKTFGAIKLEQRLAKEVSDYFYNQIAPKSGFNFVDKDGEPSKLFSPD